MRPRCLSARSVSASRAFSALRRPAAGSSSSRTSGPLRECARHGEQPELAEGQRAGGHGRAVGEARRARALRGPPPRSGAPRAAPTARAASPRRTPSASRSGSRPSRSRARRDVRAAASSGRRCRARPRAPVRRPARDVVPLHDDASRVDAEQPGDAAEQRRLARAVRADQARQRAALDRRGSTSSTAATAPNVFVTPRTSQARSAAPVSLSASSAIGGTPLRTGPWACTRRFFPPTCCPSGSRCGSVGTEVQPAARRRQAPEPRLECGGDRLPA